MRRRLAAAALIALALVLVAHAGLAHARPGGGESFSGGGGHGGSGGGGAVIFELVFQLIRLTIYYPQIGLPLLAIVAVVLIVGYIQKRRNKDWNSGPPVPLAKARAPRDVLKVDPDFSWVLFEDFCFRLFATAHGARGRPGALDQLAPYVGPGPRNALAKREPVGATVTRVIVGAQRVFDVHLPDKNPRPDAPPPRMTIAVEFEANYTAGTTPKDLHTWYTVERWTFARDPAVRTRPPKVRAFVCPNCGAPWQARDSAGTQACAYCGEVVDNGRFDWQVVGIELCSADPRPPTLTAEVPERGTDLPTYHAPDLAHQWQGLVTADPAFDKDTFLGRLALVYGELNQRWSQNDLRPARGYMSDGLYDYLSYWMTAYAEQGLHNALVDMRILGKELAKVSRDRWYDAITVRIWATGKDYVVDRAGKVVRGSKHRERRYSEYWTFIRSSARRGAATIEPACPSCGAPLSISMAGACEHCGAHLTTGEFDWVLSKIEQDDTYRG